MQYPLMILFIGILTTTDWPFFVRSVVGAIIITMAYGLEVHENLSMRSHCWSMSPTGCPEQASNARPRSGIPGPKIWWRHRSWLHRELSSVVKFVLWSWIRVSHIPFRLEEPRNLHLFRCVWLVWMRLRMLTTSSMSFATPLEISSLVSAITTLV